MDDSHSQHRPIVVIALSASTLETKMFGFWRCKADTDSETAVETPVAAEPVAAVPSEPEPQPEPVVEVAETTVSDIPAETPPAAEPEPPKMPHKVTAEEMEAAKEELVNEVVQKLLEIPGAVTDTITTAPYDPRFPSTNQNRHCFIRYNEYYKCAFERGAEDQRCTFYKNAYESLCPPDWVEEWEELRQQGIWFGKY